MEDYKQRVKNEKAELDEKLNKLNGFFGTETFDGLDEAEKERLSKQANVMSEYSSILYERIEAF